MSINNLSINSKNLQHLTAHPQDTIESHLKGNMLRTHLGIINYISKINTYYSKFIKGNTQQLCHKAQIPHAFGFNHFGLIIEFEKATEVAIHDEDLKLVKDFRQLVERYGVVIIRNAYMCSTHRSQVHMNIFPHLNFHRDRNDQHDNKYTLFTRDPFNPEHKEPRPSSTLIIDNAVAYLQCMKEGGLEKNESGRRSHYMLFENEDVPSLFNDIVFEIPWDAPSGTGEIGIINNRTVLHSSYRKHIGEKGYAIGARYLF